MNLIEDILRDADRCVLCGICQPHCPTYALSRSEVDSPRGRIALMHAVASGRLPASEDVLLHLDNCLVCRRCERVCPSQVPYGRLMVNMRTWLAGQREQGSLPLKLLSGGSLDYIRGALRLYELSGAQAVVRRTGILGHGTVARLEAMLPQLPKGQKLKSYNPPVGEERGRVALFTGCTGNLLEQETLIAARDLLARWGYGVYVPSTQRCCGALDLHEGRREAVRTAIQKNVEAFAGLGVQAVIAVASGCGGVLAEYSEWLQAPETAEFAELVRDISDFLVSVPWPEGVVPAPLPAKVAVHIPCSLNNVLRKPEGPFALLARIPEIQLEPLADNDRCCGAAGSHMLSHPETADALADAKINALRESGARLLVSSNVGCALHLRNAIRRAGLDVEVLHPVALLARQLG